MIGLAIRNSTKRNRWKWLAVSLGVVALIVGVGWWSRQRAIYRFLNQDTIWAEKVRAQINFDETRAWALSVVKQADPEGPVTEHQSFLTNAPGYLLKNYKSRPYVMHRYDFIHLRYGGGLYSWGLTIGATNLEARFAEGSGAEQWAPGIYYWRN